MLNRKSNRLLAIMLFVCMIASAIGPIGTIYADEEPASGALATPGLTIEQSALAGALDFDLSEVGNVDWLHLKGNGPNQLTQIKKAESDAISFSILTDKTGFEGKMDRGNDANYVSYSWADGMEGYERGSKDTGFAIFFPKDSRNAGTYTGVGWTFGVKPQPEEATVVFALGLWQAKSEVRFYANDQLIEMKPVNAGGTSQIYRYQVTVPAGVELKVEGMQTEAIANGGNTTLSGIAVSSKQVVNKVNLLNLYNTEKDTAQGLYTDESWAVFTAARNAAKAVLDNKEATQAEVDDAFGALQGAKSALVKRITNMMIDYTGTAKAEYQFGDPSDQQDRYQTFTPGESFTSQYVQVSLRKNTNQVTDLIVKLYATNAEGLPTGDPLHSVTVSKDDVQDNGLTTIPFAYELEAGKRYALVLRQEKLGSSNYRWYVMNHTAETKNEYFGKTANGAFKHEASLGTGIMRVIKHSDVNKTAIAALLKQANAMSSKLYTVQSWTNLQLYRQLALEIMNNFDAEQEAVETAATQLAGALDALVPNKATSEPAALAAELESAKIEGYTASSVASLQAAIDAAKNLNANASEQEKLEAMSVIMNALDKLQPEGKYRYETNGKMTAAFGFEGDKNASLAFMDGSYQIGGARPEQHGPVAPKQMVTFGVTDISSAKWYKGEGYLPVFISEYSKEQVDYKVETFGNKHTVDQKDYVVNFSRMTVTNHSQDILLLPVVSSNLTAINEAARQQYIIHPGETVVREYAIEADKYEYFDESVSSYSSLTMEQLLSLGSYTGNYDQMKSYWNNRLDALVQLDLPNKELVHAFKAGYIDMMIVKDGNFLHVGENGYARLYSHDTLGIIVQLLQSGDFAYAKEYLKTVPLTGGINVETGQIDGNLYWDANWKLPWVYAVYYSKTGDASIFDEMMTADDGSVGTVFEKRVKVGARSIETDRTAEGIMKKTYAIDDEGYWTIDNYSALTGLTAYEYLTRELYAETKDAGYLAEAEWAKAQYADLLEKFTAVLENTITSKGLDYIPISAVQSNDENRTRDSRDANWASMYLFGRWLWDGYLYGAIQPEDNINLTMLDDTYTYGIERRLKEGTTDSPYNFGGYPHGFYSSAYNAGYGSSALRGEQYRDMGIKAYEFMLEHSMSAPFSWWEGINYPEDKGWVQTNDQLNIEHTPGGGGSAQHMWGQSVNSKVLVDSLIAERIYDNSVKVDIMIGRGIPKEWVADAAQNHNVVAEVRNYPVLKGSRAGYKIERDLDKLIVTLQHNVADISKLDQDVQFSIQLPSMVDNIAAVSTGSYDAAKGIVNVPFSVNRVEITLADLVEDAEKIRQDQDALQIGYAAGDSETAVTKSLQLPTAGEQGSVIAWSSSHPEIVSVSGAVTRPGADTAVTLTAQLKLGDNIVQKEFAVTVLKKPGQSGGGDTGGGDNGTGTPGNSEGEGNNGNNGEEPGESNGGTEGNNGGSELPRLTDIAGHWAKKNIEEAVARHIVNGYPDGTFRPEGIVNRSEFAVMMGRVLEAVGKTGKSGKPGELSFKDAASIPSWAKSYIADGVARGYITGYGDHTFKPTGKITRLELVAMIARAMELSASGNELKFADAKDIPAWGAEYVAAAYEAGIINGKNNNRFAPNDVATRAEAVTMLLRAIAIMEAK